MITWLGNIVAISELFLFVKRALIRYEVLLASAILVECLMRSRL